MERGKYIIFEIVGTEYPILFPSLLDHSTMAGNRNIVSAGMFEVCAEPSKDDEMDISVWAGNKSVTLNVKSRPEDAEIIKRILRHKYTF